MAEPTTTEPVAAAVPFTPEQAADKIADASRRAFEAATADRQRDPHQVGISSLGGCTRAAAYALARTPVSDDPGPEEGRAANLGTWQHEGFLPRLSAELRPSDIEVEVRLRAAGLSITGHIDLDWTLMPLDLKTVGEHRLGRVRRAGDPYYAHRVQDAAYGLARMQEGRDTPMLGWHYLDRASGDEEIIVKPFTNRDALDVIDRVRLLRDYAESDPDMAPRDERGPGLSIVCNRCPWLRRCWGDEAEPGVVGAQASLVTNNAQASAALAQYVAGRDLVNQGEAMKDDAEAKLSRTRFDVYVHPDRPDLAIKYGRNKSSSKVNNTAAVARLIELGEQPPRVTSKGALRITVVKRPKVVQS